MPTVNQSSEIKQYRIFSSWNEKLEANKNIWFWILFGVLAFMSLIFFDPKVSIGGDDSEYINRAFSFIKKGRFPTFQGPLYPITIGLIMSISGLSLIIFKLASVVFMLIHFWLFYKTFEKHLPPIVLFAVMAILSINASMLYFASSTFTESFFLMIQSLFLFVFERYFISEDQKQYSLKKDYKKILLLGLTLFFMAVTKNIGLTAVIGTSLFFIIRFRWLALAYTLLAFLIFQGAFFAIKKYSYDVDVTQVSSQSSTLMMKHPYDASQGEEDLSGFVNRIVVNSKEYLSKHFTLIFGLNKESKPGSSGFITVLIYLILFSGFLLLFKKSDFWAFTGIYLIASCGITFVVLQTYWSQERLILVYTPLILVYLVYALYYIIENFRPNLNWVLMLVLILFFGGNLIRTLKKLPDTFTSLGQYLKGNTLYGFTPDWIHYFEMSKWVTKNLPEDAFVGCRKPGMAFLYSGGKEFYGIWRVPSEDPEELYNKLKEAGVTHVMMASLRLVPDRNTGRTITTVRRYLSIVNNAYPGKLEFVHKIGEEEPVFLYKLN